MKREPTGRDLNDVVADAGVSAIYEAVENAKTWPRLSVTSTVVNAAFGQPLIAGEVNKAPLYVVRRAADLLAGRPMRWRVHGVLPESGLAAFYGPSGGGKSFLLLDICIAIAEGADHWFGRRVKPAPVAYVCLEGEAGISKRLKAWSVHNGRPLPDALQVVISQPVDLRSLTDVHRLCESLKLAGISGGVIAIDTLAQATPGFDENSGQDMSEVLTASKAIQASLGGLLILVHHTGKTDGKGLRGHSSLLAALDSSIEISRNGPERRWSVAKSKDDADGESCEFQLETVELDDDEDGNPVTSCVINPSAATPKWSPEKPKGDEQILVYDAIGKLLLGSKVFGKDPSHPSRPGVFLEEAVEAASSVLTCEPNRRKNRARRAIARMITRGIYDREGEFIWLR